MARSSSRTCCRGCSASTSRRSVSSRRRSVQLTSHGSRACTRGRTGGSRSRLPPAASRSSERRDRWRHVRSTIGYSSWILRSRQPDRHVWRVRCSGPAAGPLPHALGAATRRRMILRVHTSPRKRAAPMTQRLARAAVSGRRPAPPGDELQQVADAADLLRRRVHVVVECEPREPGVDVRPKGICGLLRWSGSQVRPALRRDHDDGFRLGLGGGDDDRCAHRPRDRADPRPISAQ